MLLLLLHYWIRGILDYVWYDSLVFSLLRKIKKNIFSRCSTTARYVYFIGFMYFWWIFLFCCLFFSLWFPPSHNLFPITAILFYINIKISHGIDCNCAFKKTYDWIIIRFCWIELILCILWFIRFNLWNNFIEIAFWLFGFMRFIRLWVERKWIMVIIWINWGKHFDLTI